MIIGIDSTNLLAERGKSLTCAFKPLHLGGKSLGWIYDLLIQPYWPLYIINANKASWLSSTTWPSVHQIVDPWDVYVHAMAWGPNQKCVTNVEDIVIDCCIAYFNWDIQEFQGTLIQWWNYMNSWVCTPRSSFIPNIYTRLWLTLNCHLSKTKESREIPPKAWILFLP